LNDTGKARQKTTIKIKHAKEALECLDISWLRKGKDGLDLTGKRR
jgi:hypothetical protein